MSSGICREEAKTWMEKAHQQLTSGCGRTPCMNPKCASSPFCKRESSTAIAVDLLKSLQMLKRVPSAAEFLLCPKLGWFVSTGEILSMSVPELLTVLKDASVLGSLFVLGDCTASEPGVDWDALSVLNNKLAEVPGLLKAVVSALPHDQYSVLYGPRIVLLLLYGEGFTDVENYGALTKLCKFIDSSGLLVLSTWFDRLASASLAKYLATCQQYLSISILKLVSERGSFPGIKAVLRVCDALFQSNERVPRVDYKEFYNDAVNTEINLKKDYVMWARTLRRGSPEDEHFAFALFPWILDANSKSVYMKLETHETIISELQAEGFTALLNPYLRLEVTRENLLKDTLSQLLSGDVNIKKPLKVHFVGELGIDEGGVRKEFFQLITRDLFDPSFSMFQYHEHQGLYWFNPDTIEIGVNFELVGTLLGMAIYNSITLDVHLPMALYKKLLDVPTNIEDLREFDPGLASGLDQLLTFEGNVEETFCRSFIVETEAFGARVAHELKGNGTNLAVTNENCHEYVRLHVDWWLNTGVAEQFKEFKRGFLKACEGDTLRFFKPEELEQLICGNPVLNFHDLQRVTLYQDGYSASSPQVSWFWEILHSLTVQDKKNFLSFCTGSDRAPINGLGSMVFKISKNGPDSDRLMTAHTCFNHLLLPEYSSQEKMRKLFLVSIRNSQGFGLR